VNGRRVYY